MATLIDWISSAADNYFSASLECLKDRSTALENTDVSSINYDGSNLSIDIEKSSSRRVLQLLQVNQNKFTEALASDGHTSIWLTFSSTSASLLNRTNSAGSRESLTGAFLKLTAYEWRFANKGDPEFKITLAVNKCMLLRNVNSSESGNPQPIHEKNKLILTQLESPMFSYNDLKRLQKTNHRVKKYNNGPYGGRKKDIVFHGATQTVSYAEPEFASQIPLREDNSNRTVSYNEDEGPAPPTTGMSGGKASLLSLLQIRSNSRTKNPVRPSSRKTSDKGELKGLEKTNEFDSRLNGTVKGRSLPSSRDGTKMDCQPKKSANIEQQRDYLEPRSSDNSERTERNDHKRKISELDSPRDSSDSVTEKCYGALWNEFTYEHIHKKQKVESNIWSVPDEDRVPTPGSGTMKQPKIRACDVTIPPEQERLLGNVDSWLPCRRGSRGPICRVPNRVSEGFIRRADSEALSPIKAYSDTEWELSPSPPRPPRLTKDVLPPDSSPLHSQGVGLASVNAPSVDSDGDVLHDQGSTKEDNHSILGGEQISEASIYQNNANNLSTKSLPQLITSTWESEMLNKGKSMSSPGGAIDDYKQPHDAEATTSQVVERLDGFENEDEVTYTANTTNTGRITPALATGSCEVPGTGVEEVGDVIDVDATLIESGRGLGDGDCDYYVADTLAEPETEREGEDATDSDSEESELERVVPFSVDDDRALTCLEDEVSDVEQVQQSVSMERSLQQEESQDKFEFADVEDAVSPSHDTVIQRLPAQKPYKLDATEVDNKDTCRHQGFCSTPSESHLHLYDEFKSAYPEYSGSVTHFKGLCEQIHYELKNGNELSPSLWDSFVISHRLRYTDYIIRCCETGQRHTSYSEFFPRVSSDTTYDKGILNSHSLGVVLGQLIDLEEDGQGVLATTPESSTSDETPKPKIHDEDKEVVSEADSAIQLSQSVGQGRELSVELGEGGRDEEEDEEEEMSTVRQVKVVPYSPKSRLWSESDQSQVWEEISSSPYSASTMDKTDQWWNDENTPFKSFARAYLLLKSVRAVESEQVIIDETGNVQVVPRKLDILSWNF